GGAGDPEHRLEVGADVLAVLGEHLVRRAEPKRRKPPRDVVIAGHDDRLAHQLRLADELACALELAGARPLRDVARDRHDVVLASLDQRFDRLVLLGHRRVPEVEIGAVKQRRDGHSRAMTASVNWSVVALPPRSPVSVWPSRIVDSSAVRTRVARSASPIWSRSMQAASTSALGFATPLPAISGAVPCTASKMAPLIPMFAPGARPRPPTSPEI